MSTIAQPAAVPSSASRRGGRRGGGTGTAGGRRASVNAAAAQPDDTEEIRLLRAKYADKLASLKEMFPGWSDEDLLLTLQEAGGEMELAVGRISEGHAEQFASVKSKKQVKKETGSVVTPATFQNATTPSVAPAGAIAGGTRGGRGGIAGSRGGRGGATATRGARGGGRGALRGSSTGRGGASLPIDGKPTTSSTSKAKGTQSGATWADAVAATSSKTNGGANTDWGDDTEGLDLKTSTAAPNTTSAVEGAASSAKEPVQTSEQAPRTTAATASTTSPAQEEPGMVASALAKILPSSLVPKGSKMSWAQIARPAEPAKMEISEPVLTGAYTSAAAQEIPTEPSALRAQQATDSGALAALSKQDDEAHAAPPPAPVTSSLESEPTATNAGFPSTHDDTPVAAAGALDPVTTTAPPSKPGLGRAAQSQRAIQRAKQQEAVVMAGSNAQYDNLGVRFGSLNFLGGEENDAQTEEATTNGATAAPALNQYETSPGQQGYAATNTYADHFGQPKQNSAAAAAAASAPAAPSHVQQQTQTTPSHQDAFTQASSSPYTGNKQEGLNTQHYGYQQSQQHYQAHQAAVAQAQQAHQQLPQQSTTTTQVDHYQQQSAPDAGGYTASPAVQSSQGGQHQQPNSQYADYYASLDSQRLASFYGGNYDQQSALNARGGEERSAAQQAPVSSTDVHQQPHHPSAGHASTAQQQFPNVMPYYYPQYYLPNQFQQQHYGQPAAGYGQYALYGQQQPQHPSSKPAAAPASHQSPYSQSGPADSAPYGNSAAGQYGQSPATSSLTASGTGYDSGLSRQGTNATSNDYSKLYGNMATPTSTHSSSIPGLGGFLGQTPSGPTNGSNNTSQTKSNAPSNALENAYRGYDNGKVSPAQQGQQPHLTQQSGAQQQQQQGQQQRQQPGATPQQQQQYYQQYNAYAAHQPGAATGNYGSYPYNRQYWQ